MAPVSRITYCALPSTTTLVSTICDANCLPTSIPVPHLKRFPCAEYVALFHRLIEHCMLGELFYSTLYCKILGEHCILGELFYSTLYCKILGEHCILGELLYCTFS
jgi:hypothetical protein